MPHSIDWSEGIVDYAICSSSSQKRQIHFYGGGGISMEKAHAIPNARSRETFACRLFIGEME
jgi:hypothetical protein